jgi:hypothetical protein
VAAQRRGENDGPQEVAPFRVWLGPSIRDAELFVKNNFTRCLTNAKQARILDHRFTKREMFNPHRRFNMTLVA